MKYSFRIPAALIKKIREDLIRKHPYAFERVGFLSCYASLSENGSLIMYAYEYEPVAENAYISNTMVGAMIGPSAIKQALELAFNGGEEQMSVFHVHSHMGEGIPWFSYIDLSEQRKFVPDFFHAAPKVPHGALVFNDNHASGQIWLEEKDKPFRIGKFISMGVPIITSIPHE